MIYKTLATELEITEKNYDDVVNLAILRMSGTPMGCDGHVAVLKRFSGDDLYKYDILDRILLKYGYKLREQYLKQDENKETQIEKAGHYMIRVIRRTNNPRLNSVKIYSLY